MFLGIIAVIITLKIRKPHLDEKQLEEDIEN